MMFFCWCKSHFKVKILLRMVGDLQLPVHACWQVTVTLQQIVGVFPFCRLIEIRNSNSYELITFFSGVVSGAILQLRAEFSLDCTQQEMVVSSMLMGAVLASLVGGNVGVFYLS